ncbi:MAG: hypothetical protein ACTSRP_14690 [Candidatus Helarchaeota archaeon]
MKILLITANFAPRSASHSIRTVHLVKYFYRLGINTYVITYNECALTLFSNSDDFLSKKVPSSCDVYRLNSGILRKVLLYIKKHKKSDHKIQSYKENMKKNPLVSFLIPDPHIDAFPQFFLKSAQIIRKKNPDVILTTAYPYTIHIVGLFLKKLFPNIIWVTDYGDPWTGNPVNEMNLANWRNYVDYNIEKKVLNNADAIFLTTKETINLYEKLFGEKIKEKSYHIPMGFDPDDFSSISSIARKPEEIDKIWFVHTGRLYTSARDPKPFIEALNKIKNRYNDIEDKISIYLVGEIEKEIMDYINDSPCKKLFKFIPWVPVDKSISWMKAADYLLLFGNKGGVQIPGKIYQYIGCNRPIFMIYEKKDDPTLDIISNLKNNIKVFNKVDAIAKQIIQIIQTKNKNLDESSYFHYSAYAWPTIAKNCIDIFKGYLKKN